MGNEELDQNSYFVLRRTLLEVAAHSKQLPSSAFVTGVKCKNRDSVAGGAFADIFRGKLGPTLVALKRLRVFRDYPSSDASILVSVKDS